MSQSPGSTILITGGTGSFGSAFARHILDNTECKVRIFSRDEHRQETMADSFPPGPRMTYILGDIKEYDKLCVACDGCDMIVHAAALKTVPAGERHADEFARTNVDGSMNVVWAAHSSRVSKSILISSDKAVSPQNLYGSTKMVAERLFVQANKIGVGRDCRLAAVRGGNVFGSRGSVTERWKATALKGSELPVTDSGATRFFLRMSDWTAFVWRAINEMAGGEIFIPRARAWRLMDLAVATGRPIVEIGRRPGDKQHETLYSADESYRTVDAGWAFVVQPPEDLRAVWNYRPHEGTPVMPGMAYTSETAERMPVAELAALLAAPI